MSRRKSKWDVPADAVANSNGSSSSNSAAEAAKERAAKLTAMLAAKGKLANNTGSILPVAKPVIGFQPLPKIEKEQDLITAEVEINDSPSRIILCKGTTQDEINRYSGAAVSTKGRFLDAEERLQESEGVRPLYLCIQGTSQDKVDKAVQRIQEIMAGSGIFGKQSAANQSRWSSYQSSTVISTPAASPITQAVATQAIPTGMHYVQDKVFVGLDSTCSPDFNVKEKLIGPAGSYFQHITTETGAKVFLRGKGSGFLEPTSGREAFEALHIYISHAKPEGLSAAKTLVENLIETVNNEYKSFEQLKRAQQAGHIPQPGYPSPGYIPPMVYPPRPGMPHPPGSYPIPPGPIPPPPGGYYRQPPPPGPVQPPVAPYPVPPHGYGPPPQQGPPLPRGHSNGSTPTYPGYSNPPAPPNIGPFPPRPIVPSSINPPKSTPIQMPERKESENQNNRERPLPQEMPLPAGPQPEPPRRRFKEASRSELTQESQPRNYQERIPEPSPLGNKQDPRHKNVSMLPPLMPQMKSQPNPPGDEFKKPLGAAKTFLVPPPPKDIIRKENTLRRPELPGNTRKHVLPKTSDESPSKRSRKEEKDTTSALLSLVAYDEDSSEEEDETTSPTSQSYNRAPSKPKTTHLPFWAVGK